jgi:hypothetical protein
VPKPGSEVLIIFIFRFLLKWFKNIKKLSHLHGINEDKLKYYSIDKPVDICSIAYYSFEKLKDERMKQSFFGFKNPDRF